MALSVSEWTTAPTSPEMREAARFVHYLRHAASDHRSFELYDWWRAYSALDDSSARFTQVAVQVSGERVYWCEECGKPHWSWSFFGYARGISLDVCEGCLEEFYYCDDCDEYDREPHEHEDEDEDSWCQAPNLEFRFPCASAEGGFIAHDDRTLIDMPAGLVSAVGMSEIARYVYNRTNWIGGFDHVLHGDFSPEWVNKHGNMTKRLAKFYLQHGYKLSPEHLAEVGNIARRHTCTETRFEVEVTRDLNLPAADFFYGGSCWWGGYARGRCALKQCGGLAIRTFDGHLVSGRAWIMPLRRNGSELTLHEHAHDADAFCLFNTYGQDGYQLARLVAQMTGMSYRKVNLVCKPMYINDNKGFLIAPEQICQQTTELAFKVVVRCECY